MQFSKDAILRKSSYILSQICLCVSSHSVQWVLPPIFFGSFQYYSYLPEKIKFFKRCNWAWSWVPIQLIIEMDFSPTWPIRTLRAYPTNVQVIIVLADLQGFTIPSPSSDPISYRAQMILPGQVIGLHIAESSPSFQGPDSCTHLKKTSFQNPESQKNKVGIKKKSSAILSVLFSKSSYYNGRSKARRGVRSDQSKSTPMLGPAGNLVHQLLL